MALGLLGQKKTLQTQDVLTIGGSDGFWEELSSVFQSVLSFSAFLCACRFCLLHVFWGGPVFVSGLLGSSLVLECLSFIFLSALIVHLSPCFCVDYVALLTCQSIIKHDEGVHVKERKHGLWFSLGGALVGYLCGQRMLNACCPFLRPFSVFPCVRRVFFYAKILQKGGHFWVVFA